MGLSHSPRMVTNGLVLCLDAGNTRSYPGSGTTWTDLSGNGNNGTLTNGPTFSSSNGGSVVFDGVNDYVETNYVPPSSTSYSIGFWAKSSGTGASNRAIGNGDSTAGASGTGIIWGFTSSDTIYFLRRTANDGTRDITSSSIPNLLTAIHYVVGTYNTASGSVLYVDGVQVGSNINLGYTGSLTLRIGRDGNGTDAFNGTIYNAHIYNRALSAAEIRQNFNATRGRYGI